MGSWLYGHARAHARPTASAPGHGTCTDEGFTLIELLIAISILPLIVGAIAVATISSFGNAAAVSARVADSHDAQISSAYFARDVESATLVSTSTTSSLCPSTGTSQLLGLSWTQGDQLINVSYGLSSGTTMPLLQRRYCVGTTETSVRNLASGLFKKLSAPTLSQACAGASSCASAGGHTGLAITVDCAGTPVTTGCANKGLTTTYPTATSPGILSVTLTGSENPSQYTFKLTGSPRDQGVQTGLEPPGSAGPPLVLLGTGSPNLSCSGSGHAGPVTVYGGVAVNSSSGGSISFGSGYSLTATSVYSQDGSASVPVSPPSDFTGTYVTGPPLPDPYAALPDPNTSGMTTYAGPSIVGPGVYTSPVSVTGSVTLTAGVYVFEGGLSVSGNGYLTGSGVMLFLGTPNPTTTAPQSAQLDVSGKGQVNVTSASSGAYQGVIVFQSRYDTATLNVSGNGASNTYGGVIYAANAQVNSAGNGQLNAGSVVSQTIVCGGNGGIAIGFAVLSQTPSDSTPTLGSSITDAVQVVGAPGLGAPVGTISFSECGSSATEPCTSYTPLGSVSLTPGANDASTATGPSFKPTSPGYWCFSASFASTDGTYGPTSDASIDGCVLVGGPSDLSITFPVGGTTYVHTGNANGSWTRSAKAACTVEAICGTATDVGGTIQTVTVSLQGPGGSCWTGTGSAFTASCQNPVNVTITPGASVTWSEPFVETDFGGVTGSYTLTVVATDSFGLTITNTTTFKVS